MATKKIYAIRDQKVESYGPLVVEAHIHNVVRSLTSIVNDDDRKNHYSAYPEDYALYYLGTYDDTTGIITTNQTPQLVLQLTSLKTVQKFEQTELSI
jgi:hypothetical protein